MKKGEKQIILGREKGCKNTFRNRHSETSNGLKYKITSLDTSQKLTSFTVEARGHCTLKNGEDMLYALSELNDTFKKDMQYHHRVNKDIWNVVIYDLNYPDTITVGGSTYLQLDVTCILKRFVMDYEACEKDVMRVLELSQDILDNSKFTFTEKRIRK